MTSPDYYNDNNDNKNYYNNKNNYNNNNNKNNKNNNNYCNYFTIMHCINQINKNKIISNETINVESLIYKLNEMMTPKDNINDITCSICMDEEKCMAFINCGHMCICESCKPRVDKCPICRTHGPIIKIFK